MSACGFGSAELALSRLENRSLQLFNSWMDTTRVTAGEFQQAFGTLSDQARREPVIITQEGHDDLVVMSAEEWARLRRRQRRAGLTSELSEEWVEAARHAKVPEEFAYLDDELK